MGFCLFACASHPCICAYVFALTFVCVCVYTSSRKDSLHSELEVLSESYSQRCLELSRTEQSCGDRQTDLGRREREMEQLRRENQVREPRKAKREEAKGTRK